MKLGIGIDTGGTYTDAVIYDFDNRKVVAKGKSLTTKENLEIGIGNALDSLPEELAGQASVLSLSTTLATNASVENKGGRAKLVMIGSNRKIMEWVYAGIVYGLKDEDVFCVDTNSSFDGKIIDDPDWELITAKEDEWFSDAQALAVADVYAMRNGAVSERSAKEKLTSKYAVPLVMASELANDLNVMERGATALLNAKLLPTIEEFMEAVKAALKKRHLNIKEMIVRSDGSLMSDDMALTHPVKTILSGPAASVIGGRGLTDCSDCLIVDMGGTTTDISIVQGGEPIMTDGIRIGGFRTQVRGVFIDTFGLGGDSRITVDNGKIVLNARRVQPLCIAASMFPQIVNELSVLIYSNRTGTLPLYEFLYLVRKPADPRRYNTKELELIRKLDKRPLMLGGGMLDLYDIKSKRLEDEGIVMRCGLTPTDIMHILGDFTRYDKTASVLGAKYFLKVLPEYKETTDDLMRLCNDIYDLVRRKLYENIVRILLTNKYPKLFSKGIDEQMMMLIRESRNEESFGGFFGFGFHTDVSLIGIGAPTHIFLPDVAEKLGTKCVIPDHAEVANAVGAIIADISVQTVVNISPEHTPNGISGYTVRTAEETKTFKSTDEAVAYAGKAAELSAVADARKRGALGELRVEIIVKPDTAYTNEGIVIDLGTEVTAYVTGRI